MRSGQWYREFLREANAVGNPDEETGNQRGGIVAQQAWLPLAAGSFVETVEIIGDERFLFLAGPLFELAISADGSQDIIISLAVGHPNRPAVASEKCGSAGVVVGKALTEVLGVTDV